MLYAEMNPYYSTPKVSRMVKVLERHGLVTLGIIREGGRLGVPGVWPTYDFLEPWYEEQ